MIITLTVTCVFGIHLKEDCIRVIEIDEEADLGDLHEAIQKAVRFDRDHLYDFYLASRPFGKQQMLTATEDGWGGQADGSPLMLLRDVFPTGRMKLYYIFDYGDSWTFEIRKARGSKPAEKGVKYPRVVKSVGPNPAQYPDVN